MKQVSLDVFLPVFNEAGRVRKSALSLKKFLDSRMGKRYKTRIIVVDDNSSDSTPDELRRLEKETGIRHVRFSNGPSRRENLGRAMNRSSADIIMFMDSDLATDLKHIPRLVSLVEKGSHIATGSRYLKGSKLKRELSRWMISKAYNSSLRLVFGSKVCDHQCGFKAFSRDAFRATYRKMGYDRSFTRGWFWDAEMLIRAQKRGFTVSEIPVTWTAADQSSFNVKREIRMIPYIINLRFRL